MDLNHLYFQHQLASMRAFNADDPLDQATNQARADECGQQIARHQLTLSAPASGTWEALSSFSVRNLPQLRP